MVKLAYKESKLAGFVIAMPDQQVLWSIKADSFSLAKLFFFWTAFAKRYTINI